MGNRYAEIAFTETIKDVQRSMGSRSVYARSELIEETFHQCPESRRLHRLGRRGATLRSQINKKRD